LPFHSPALVMITRGFGFEWNSRALDLQILCGQRRTSRGYNDMPLLVMAAENGDSSLISGCSDCDAFTQCAYLNLVVASVTGVYDISSHLKKLEGQVPTVVAQMCLLP
jgi:hypothetical protein